MRKLNANRVQLLDLIEADSAFVTQLASPDVACITWSQREHILEMLHRRDRSERLLDCLTRRSVADYVKFIKVLAERQAHLVCLLEPDGGEIYIYIYIYIYYLFYLYLFIYLFLFIFIFIYLFIFPM